MGALADGKALVERVVEMLGDDAFRRGGSVEINDVLRLSEKFALSPEQLVEVKRRLSALEIEIEGDGEGNATPRPTESDPVEPGGEDEAFRDILSAYFKDIGKLGLLTKEGEVELMRRVRSGEAAASRLSEATTELREELQRVVRDGEMAFGEMVQKNLKLVIHTAKSVPRRGSLSDEDLIQEGNLGLIRAVQKFDHTRDLKFSTYATWWIWSFMMRAVVDKGSLVRVPAHLAEKKSKLWQTRRRLVAERQGKPPSTHELADYAGLPPEKVQFLLDLDAAPSSLDEPAHPNAPDSVGETIPAPKAFDPEEPAMEHELKERLDEALATLGERTAFVIRQRFGLEDGRERTLEDIGQEVGVTRERIRQIEAKALKTLRSSERYAVLKELASVEETQAQAEGKAGTDSPLTKSDRGENG